jgi:hypothetical protein
LLVRRNLVREERVERGRELAALTFSGSFQLSSIRP